MQPVVKSAVQRVVRPAASCIQTFNRLYDRLYNGLYRVNTILQQHTVGCSLIALFHVVFCILLYVANKLSVSYCDGQTDRQTDSRHSMRMQHCAFFSRTTNPRINNEAK